MNYFASLAPFLFGLKKPALARGTYFERLCQDRYV